MNNFVRKNITNFAHGHLFKSQRKLPTNQSSAPRKNHKLRLNLTNENTNFFRHGCSFKYNIEFKQLLHVKLQFSTIIYENLAMSTRRTFIYF